MSVEPGMREFRQWVCWRSEERDGKRTKVPYSPLTGARSDDPTTWATLQEARDAVARRSYGGRSYTGMGFVFTADDPFCGVDLDNCLNPDTREVHPWAMEMVQELDSYTEISPSDTGLHVIVRATLPKGGNRKDRVEMYDQGRFFTITGNRLAGTVHQIEDRQTQISTLHTRLFPSHKHNTSPRNNPPTSTNLEDSEILQRSMSARNGEKFAALWTGDRTGYASDSEADLALCSMLAFWTGPDRDRIAALVASSGLARDKWNREDYRHRTITRALSSATDFYSPDRNGSGYREDGRTSEPLSGALPGAVEFPVDAMPDSCRPLISEATASLGCAPELVALPMLSISKLALNLHGPQRA